MTREIALIAAVARNGVIGRGERLPWRLRADLQFFKAVTIHHTIVMGRKTWESLGQPLPQRRNVVLSRDPAYCAEGAEVLGSLEQALHLDGSGPIFVIGGAEIFRLALAVADRLLLTEVNAEVAGDTSFPPIPTDFVEVSRESHPADPDNEYPYSFVEYRRRR